MPRKTNNVLRIEPKPIIEFDESELLPVPKGFRLATDPSKVLDISQHKSTLDDHQIMEFRKRAEEDERLLKELGERYAFFTASIADTGDKSEATPKLDVRLEYFNYVSNRAVHVWLSDGKVGEVEVQPDGYQPPESDEEIAAAAEIVRRDPQHKEKIEGLPVLGILTPAPAGQRYVFLLFKKPKEPAVFSATVNLTASKVVKAGPIRYRHSGEQK